ALLRRLVGRRIGPPGRWIALRRARGGLLVAAGGGGGRQRAEEDEEVAGHGDFFLGGAAAILRLRAASSSSRVPATEAPELLEDAGLGLGAEPPGGAPARF